MPTPPSPLNPPPGYAAHASGLLVPTPYAAPLITRTPMFDDDGSGEVGTVLNNDWKQELYNQIDALAAATVAASGNVTGPASSTAGSLASYSDATGKVLADSGIAAAPLAAALGAWIDVPFNAANFFGTSPMTWTVAAGNIFTNRYCRIGKTLLWKLYLDNSTTGGSPAASIGVKLPGGFVAQATANAGMGSFLNGAAFLPCTLFTAAGGTSLSISASDLSNFVIGACHVHISAVIELQ
jgi:hypothetical protein